MTTPAKKRIRRLSSVMTVRVEFFGIARQRAGLEAVELEAASLSAALSELAKRLPEFGRVCMENGRLAQGYTANVNGDAFVSARDSPLQPGDTLLILSADAGG